jgi:hypothetical protein
MLAQSNKSEMGGKATKKRKDVTPASKRLSAIVTWRRMTVKKALFLTTAAAVVTLASVSAYAARPAQPISESWSLECGSISPEEGFVVTHTMISGAVYDRTDQYEDLRSWKVNNGPYQWSGRSVKYSQLVMLGTFGRDRTGQLVYMEEIYRSGRLETTVRSTCHLTD